MGNLPVSSNQLGISFHWRGWSAQALRMSRSAHSSLNRDPSGFRYDNPLDFWAETIQRYSLNYSRKWPKVSSETHVSWLNYRLNNQSGFAFLESAGPSGKSYKYAASDDLHLEEQIAFQPAKGLEVTAGLVYRYSGNLPATNSLAEPFPTSDYRAFSDKNVDDTSVFGGFGFNPLTFHRASAYAQVYYQWKSLTVLGGFRTDYHSLFDFSHSPRIAVMYKTRKGLSLRASFSTGTRVPALYYMYASEARKHDGGIYYDVVPNLSLDPEKLIAAEAGLRWMAAKWFRADIALFYHKIYEQFSRSFVILDPEEYPDAINPGSISRAYVNDAGSSATITGLQADLLFSDLVQAVNLDADLNLTLAKGREILPNNLGTINDYRQMPVFSGEFDISASPVKRLRLSVKNHFSTGWVRGYLPLDPDLLEEIGYPVRNDGYYSLDLHGRVLIGRNFEAFAHFNNLTNAHYGGIDSYSDENDLFYNPQHGFNFRLGFNFRME
jgi:outer membrane receptor protein involved in Fe transport